MTECASSTVAVVHRDAHVRNQLRPGAEEEEHHQIHVPFPFDHFFFCFLAPVAGAILTDLLGVRWVVDGWSVDCLKWLEEVGGVVKKNGRLPDPYPVSAPHHTQLRSGPKPGLALTQRYHSRRAWAVRAGSRGGRRLWFFWSGGVDERLRHTLVEALSCATAGLRGGCSQSQIAVA